MKRPETPVSSFFVGRGTVLPLKPFGPAAALALLAVGVLGFARKPTGTTASRVRPGRVLLIGDSLAVGLKAPLAALANQAGIPFETRAVEGTHIPQWSANASVDETLARFQPTHVLVSLGTNDEKVGTGIAAREAPALRALLQKIQSAGAEVAWIGPPALPFSRVGVSDMIRAAVPRYFSSETLSIPRAGDGLHPTGAGYASWAAAIWSWLTS